MGRAVGVGDKANAALGAAVTAGMFGLAQQDDDEVLVAPAPILGTRAPPGILACFVCTGFGMLTWVPFQFDSAQVGLHPSAAKGTLQSKAASGPSRPSFERGPLGLPDRKAQGGCRAWHAGYNGVIVSPIVILLNGCAGGGED